MADLVVAQLGQDIKAVFEYGANDIVTAVRLDNPNNVSCLVIYRRSDNKEQIFQTGVSERLNLPGPRRFNYLTDPWPNFELGTVK